MNDNFKQNFFCFGNSISLAGNESKKISDNFITFRELYSTGLSLLSY